MKRYYYLIPLLCSLFFKANAQAQGVEITDRLSAQKDLPTAAQIIDGKYMPIGSGTSITSLHREEINGEIVYHFEADETANRVELTTCFGEEANLQGVSAQERADLSALKNLYKYDYEGNYGETVTYEWSTLFPEPLTASSGGIFAQWHGRPDRTLFKDPKGMMQHYTVSEALAMLDTMYFTEHIGYSTATDQPNGWEIDAAAGGPIGAFKITEGYMALVVRSDNNRMSNSLTKVKPTPGQDLNQVVGSNGKTGSVVFERPISQVPINQWIKFKVRIKYSDYNTEEDEVTRTGRVEVWVDDEKVGDWTGDIGKNDLKGPYFKCGIYKPGTGGFKNSVKNIDQYYNSAPDKDQTLEPVADSFISGDTNADTNYNSDDRLLSKAGNGTNDRSTFLKFDLSGIDIDKVESATLRLTPVAGKTWTASTTGLWYVSDDNWTEAGLTYNNAPTTAVSIGTINNSSGGVIEEFDITNQVQQENDDLLSLKVTGTNGGGTSRQYNSREFATAADRPLLILTMKSVPEAAFKTASRNVVEGTQVTYTDLSLNNPTSWNWSFPGGTPATSTDQSPTVTYTSPGEYNASLSVTNADGSNAMEKEAHINVISYFQSTADYILEPVLDAYVSGGSNANTNYGSAIGLQSKNGSDANHKFSFLRYDLNAFSQSAVEKVLLRLTPVENQSWTSSDTEIYAVADDNWTESGLTYNTMPSNGSLIVARQSSTGDAVEEFDVTNHISIENDNQLSLMIASTHGGGASKEFNSKDYPIAKDRPLLIVKLFDKPEAAFETNKSNIYDGETIDFTDVSTHTPTSWSWTFPGGTPATSTDQNPTVTYSTPGTYDVTLSVTNAGGTTQITQTNLVTVAASEISIEPTEDSYISGGGNAAVNYGTATGLQTKAGSDGNDKTIFIKYDLSSIALDDVEEATLILTPVAGKIWNNSTTEVSHVSDDSWTESALTYNNSPSLGSQLGSIQNSVGGVVESFDITNQVVGETDGILSLAVRGTNAGGTARQYNSREFATAAERPLLKFKLVSGDTGSKTMSTTKIAVEKSNQPLTIYPNPTKDKLFISCESNGNQEAVIVIYDTKGRIMASFLKKLHDGANKLELYVGQLPGGLYILKGNLGNEPLYSNLLIE